MVLPEDQQIVFQLRHWPQLPVDYVIARHKLLQRGEFQKRKNAGKKVFVWTVTGARDMQRFAKWGADGIISDHPNAWRPSWPKPPHNSRHECRHENRD